MVIVVSAGNDGSDLQHNGNAYVAYCDASHVICVSSVGPALATQINTPLADSPAYYTNFGRQAVDVAAPGGNADAAHNFAVSAWPWGNDIASWVWSYCSKTRIASLTAAGVPVLTACVAGNRLSGYIGTSQASPHVAGLAALLVAEYGPQHPEKIKQMIQKSADNINPLLGRGRINVLRAVSQ
jgi:subtilisin family serine protease